MLERRPDALTLLAFGGTVLIGGTNFVAVRITNRELPPLYGAGIRFGAAAALLMVIVAVARLGIPRGRSLLGAVIYGALQFGPVYALAYWGLQEAPAAMAGIVFGSTPVFTLLLAAMQGIEKLKGRAVIGAAIALAGVAVTARSPALATVPIVSIGALLLSTLGASQAGITIKRFPPMNPLAMNAVAMTVGAPILFALSLVGQERWTTPSEPGPLWALLFLIPVGSVGLFGLYVFVVQRWTATAASYQFVFFPMVSAVAAAIIADETLDATILIGGLLAMAGTYVGALASIDRSPAKRAEIETG